MTTQNEDAHAPSPETLATLNSYFGIRPGKTLVIVPRVFDGMPEAERPAFTWAYMTATTREDYNDRMDKIVGDSLVGVDREGLAAAATAALAHSRFKNFGVHKWLMKKHLLNIERYPTVDGGFLEFKKDANGEVSDETIDAISIRLIPLLVGEFLAENFANDLERAAVKS